MAEPLRREPFIEAPPSERRLSTRAQSAAYQAYLILYADSSWRPSSRAPTNSCSCW